MTEITLDTNSDGASCVEERAASGDTGAEYCAAIQDDPEVDAFPSLPDAEEGAENIVESTSMIDLGDGSVALMIVEPHSPGTIMVAVADPSDLYPDQVPSDGSEVFKAGQEAFVFQPSESSAGFQPGEAIIPRYDSLVEIAAVRLDGLGPALFFATNGVACAAGSKVVVSMEEGLAFGEVASVMQVHPEHVESLPGDDRKIYPLAYAATEKDLIAARNNRTLATEALEYCRECIGERNLDMKLVDILVLHDRSKMIFYFTAPARIDFRELVKDLVRRYRTRIELRQIGVRHETQMVGALGNCGMVCCCRRYLRKFAPVAIKMAKEQNVFLNPVKISGICGRLLCCLAYEQEHYDEFYRSCPKLGKKYQTDAGGVRVLRASLFRESVTVLSETGEEVEYSLLEWRNLNPFRPNTPQQQPQSFHKPEHQAGDGKQRKGGGRNFPPPANRQEKRESFEKSPDAHNVRNAERDHWEEPSPSDIEEEILYAESVESPPSRQAHVLPDLSDDSDAFDDDCDPGDDDSNGGSIFGLAPARKPAGNALQGGQRDGGRHRRPRYRKPSGE